MLVSTVLKKKFYSGSGKNQLHQGSNIATWLILAPGYEFESTVGTSDKMLGMESHGTVTVIDGNRYNTIMIWNQEWMAGNLSFGNSFKSGEQKDRTSM